MEKQIFDIGRGKYVFDMQTLHYFIEEANSRGQHDGSWCATRGYEVAVDESPTEEEMNSVFDEIMSLYREYLHCQNLEVLVKLKARLQDYSVRYQSLVLAEEVLNINSCLPYELRVPHSTVPH